jgi:hypothetical protein
MFCPKMGKSYLFFFVLFYFFLWGGGQLEFFTCEVLCHHQKALNRLKWKIDATFSELRRKLWKELESLNKTDLQEDGAQIRDYHSDN